MRARAYVHAHVSAPTGRSNASLPHATFCVHVLVWIPGGGGIRKQLSQFFITLSETEHQGQAIIHNTTPILQHAHPYTQFTNMQRHAPKNPYEDSSFTLEKKHFWLEINHLASAAMWQCGKKHFPHNTEVLAKIIGKTNYFMNLCDAGIWEKAVCLPPGSALNFNFNCSFSFFFFSSTDYPAKIDVLSRGRCFKSWKMHALLPKNIK